MTEQLTDLPPRGSVRRNDDYLLLRDWAKAGNKPVHHPLICHALDTAAVAYRLYPLLLGPVIRSELTGAFGAFGGPGDAVENARCWTAVFCGLHDLGKIAPAFQALRLDLAEVLHADDQTIVEAMRRAAQPKGAARVDPPHGWVTQLHLNRFLTSVQAHRSVKEAIAWGLGGHHGVIPDAARLAETSGMIRDHSGKEAEIQAGKLIDRLIELWALPRWESLPWPEARIGLAGAIGLAGLTSVSDWIASDAGNFAWAGSGFDLVEYAHGTDALAVRAVEKLDWTPWTPPWETGFTALFPGKEDAPTTPRPVQAAAERLLDGVTEPGLLVVEAPTGEGKTKLGFHAAAVLVARLGLAGMYQGMPTRATGNQVFDELDDLIASHQDDLRVRLLHGAADQHPKIKARFESAGKRKAESSSCPSPSDIGRDHEEEDEAEVREWFAGKRGIIAPVGTGTVDQLLMGVIRSRHAFVRLTGLSNKVLILDEVHGYDLYTSTLIDRLLQWAGRLGVPVVLMSATLPSARKGELIRSWWAGRLGKAVGKVDPVPVAPAYPELTWVDAHGIRTWGEVEPADGAARVSERNGNRIIAVDLETLADDDVDARAEWLLDEVAQALAAGRNIGIAVVHNLVRRVETTRQAVERAIERRGGADRLGGLEVITITGQLTVERRAEVEQQLKERFGRGAGRGQPVIVIGTQVLEQGLDLSFDVMASDLAPLDSLVQRAGRIRRHEDRGAEPLTVRLLVMGALRAPGKLKFPPHTTRIYPALLLLRTWLLLAALPPIDSASVAAQTGENVTTPSDGTVRCIHCPDDLRALVDRLYAKDFDQPVPDDLAEAMRKATTSAELLRDNAYRADRVRVQPPSGPFAFGNLTNDPTFANQTRKKGRPDGDR